MRPRHCCRGEQYWSISLSLSLICFNEATALLPWRTGARPQGEGAHAGFNEATALLPWRTSCPSCLPESAGRFNEATALLPWRTLRHSMSYTARCDASMRPRHCCRGEHVQHAGARVAAQASMRPRHCCRGERSLPWMRRSRPKSFNEATALLPWRTYDCMGQAKGSKLLQ